MKILIIKNTKALGDCLLALPMLKRFKELIGDDAFLGLLLNEKNREIALNNPFMDELFIWRETFSENIGTVKELRKSSWNVCIDLQGLFLNALIALLSGCKRRITLTTSLGHPGKVAIPFYSSIVELPPGLLAAEESAILAYFLSRVFLEKRSLPRRIKSKISPLPGNEFRPHIYLSSDEIMKASRLVERIEPFIVLCPGTPNRIKQWSAGKWARIANEIGRRGYGVVIIGSETEAPIVNEIKGGIDVPFLGLTGKTTIREAGGVISLARLVISIDNAQCIWLRLWIPLYWHCLALLHLNIGVLAERNIELFISPCPAVLVIILVAKRGNVWKQ